MNKWILLIFGFLLVQFQPQVVQAQTKTSTKAPKSKPFKSKRAKKKESRKAKKGYKKAKKQHWKNQGKRSNKGQKKLRRKHRADFRNRRPGLRPK
ncbi:MAG: hypothetical protein ACI9YL_001512 [Luteibaculaceae bacterium]|jgi:hypothetical protein